MSRILSLFILLCSLGGSAAASSLVSSEGAWCWFADPRALHYENEAGTINMTYIGYIDVHGNIKATQYDWLSGRKTDVLVRSYFQPDDHNNPTFLVLPDERVLIIYSRHTDEPAFYYRISRRAGDISDLGEEKRIATANNTTYPSPFILSDDPTHWYLCWRGINWHPTIARLTMPDANDNVTFDFGPKQIVQSTGARPYCKYQSNGKDKIYLAYTTGHPDNEMPDWLYCNYIDINQGNGPILRDLNGRQLKKIADGVFNVNKTDSYASSYPATIVDKTANVRNWVWQIAIDQDEHPVIAYPHIDNDKTTHVYWYARWNGAKWKNTWVTYGGHAFHQNWNQTERCYSGGMALDPDNINDLYLSIPTTNGQYDKNGVYEIWRYTIDDNGSVTGSEQLTSGSEKNNARPYVIPGSKQSKMRLGWMNGDYYYWMVQKSYPKGYPTSIMCDYDWQEALTPEMDVPHTRCICLGKNKTLTLGFAMNAANYAGPLFTIGEGDAQLTYALDNDYYPIVTIGKQTYRGSNRLLTSDDWATQSTGTSGDNHPTKLSTWVLTLTYDGETLTTYRNGLVDQVIRTTADIRGSADCYGDEYHHALLSQSDYYACASPLTVQSLVADMQTSLDAEKARNAINMITLPAETRTDLVLPTDVLGLSVAWASSDEGVISSNGVLTASATEKDVTLTATIGEESRTFNIKALARDITRNLLYENASLDLTGNTATGFSSNTCGLAPEELLSGLRSFTFLLTVKQTKTSKQPRLYDFGSGSGNSIFLRFSPLAAGIKLNGGTTTMVSGQQQLAMNKEYKLAVTYDAATKTTTIYVDGKEDSKGTANQSEAYQLYQVAKDTRNYIGRTQWWDGAYAADNQDFIGTINEFSLYSTTLSLKEICLLQGIDYEEKQYQAELVNPNFEGTYSAMAGSGVSSDRAIYVPEGWTADYATRNENDLTALKSGDLYYGQFFATKPQPANGGEQTYWVRQRWGSSVIGMFQELRLPAGSYQLTADAISSDTSGKSYIYVGSRKQSVSTANVWQQLTVSFEADGEEMQQVGFATSHADADTERICAFDNFLLALLGNNGIEDVMDKTAIRNNSHKKCYDLQGRSIITNDMPKGLYIREGRKLIIK